MKIKSVHLRDFRRFTDLTITDLPEAKLVVLAGPNGSGKSSIFDAFSLHHKTLSSWGIHWDPTYHAKDKSKNVWSNEHINIQFFTADSARKTYYIRTAYRNEADFELGSFAKQVDPVDQQRSGRMIDQDGTVSQNFQRLVSNALQDAFERHDGTMSLNDFRDSAIGDIRRAVSRLFPHLEMNTLGNPLSEGTFRFKKGLSDGFSYKNLSGGEKAAFDLLLDLVVKKRSFDDTIFCIDEPETHMNTRLQGGLLQELYSLIPDGSQLWIATHSIGMMRKALELYREDPNSVIFLDLDGHDFDQSVVIRPTQPNRSFWERVLRVALDDLAELIAPKKIIICEGNPTTPTRGRNESHDARCYNRIFESEYPDCKFVSGGNSHDVSNDRLKFASVFTSIISGIEALRLIDKDDHSPSQIEEMESLGLRVLSRRNIESYLYDDEIITELYRRNNREDEASAAIIRKQQLIAESIERGNPPDDVKSAAPQLYTFLKRDLALTSCGNDQTSFARECLVPLIKPGMATYENLKADIFGS